MSGGWLGEHFSRLQGEAARIGNQFYDNTLGSLGGWTGNHIFGQHGFLADYTRGLDTMSAGGATGFGPIGMLASEDIGYRQKGSSPGRALGQTGAMQAESIASILGALYGVGYLGAGAASEIGAGSGIASGGEAGATSFLGSGGGATAGSASGSAVANGSLLSSLFGDLKTGYNLYNKGNTLYHLIHPSSGNNAAPTPTYIPPVYDPNNPYLGNATYSGVLGGYGG